MNRGSTAKMSRLLLLQLGRQRYFATTTTLAPSSSLLFTKSSTTTTTNGSSVIWRGGRIMRMGDLIVHKHPMSTAGLASSNHPKQDHHDQEEEKKLLPKRELNLSDGKEMKNKDNIVSYWGVAPPKLTKDDGTPWRWSCFRPWETYKPDVTIDVNKHHKPDNLTDRIAFWTVEFLKFNTRLFFQKRHMCHAMLLETVAAVPGMVGGMLLHCKSLRRFEQSGGWIKLLLDEAENERMHLMTFIEIAKPMWYERAVVFAVQGLFFNAYFLAYLASPKLAHRICGYLEEEAVNSYTEFLNDLDKGLVENVPAPAIAIDYWRLPPDSTLRDVVFVIRADEAHHRDINHFASDIHSQGHELKEYPAPLDYH